MTKQQKFLISQRREAKMASSDLWNMAVGLMTIQAESYREDDEFEDLLPEDYD
jgi:hypothetical protein